MNLMVTVAGNPIFVDLDAFNARPVPPALTEPGEVRLTIYDPNGVRVVDTQPAVKSVLYDEDGVETVTPRPGGWRYTWEPAGPTLPPVGTYSIQVSLAEQVGGNLMHMPRIPFFTLVGR